jgi:ABC-type nitrate/sulfonate/bicarbonate transport system permease component
VVAMEFVLQIGGLGNLVSETSLMFRADELYSGVTLVVLMSATFIFLIYRAEGMVRR